MNAHAFFENYETEVGVRAQLLRPEKDASNITMSFQEVLHHGSIDHRRNALRKLAERGQPLHLAMLRRCLSHPDMELRLDDTRRASWQGATEIALGDLYVDDQPFGLCPRGALKRAVADWEALGFAPLVGLETEAFIFQRDEDRGLAAL